MKVSDLSLLLWIIIQEKLISASYELALVMSEIKQLQREKAIATKTIEILKKQIADHEHDSLDKKS